MTFPGFDSTSMFPTRLPNDTFTHFCSISRRLFASITPSNPRGSRARFRRRSFNVQAPFLVRTRAGDVHLVLFSGIFSNVG